MNAKRQLPAPVAIIIILLVAISTGVILTHAIKNVEFVSEVGLVNSI